MHILATITAIVEWLPALLEAIVELLTILGAA
jgi:hypothetical protein